MANDDNHQYYITIPNSNGETIIITPEILPEQLLPLVQKKQFKEEKVDFSNLTSVYKKFIENLTENNSTSLASISSLSNIINVNSPNSSRVKLLTSNTEQNKISDTITNSSSSILSGRSSLPTILLRHSNINQNNQNLQQSLSSEHNIISGSVTDNSNNYITTLQISQSNSNLPTLAFSQPQALLHYSNQNSDSPNTVLIPISLHNSNQFQQQQIIVAAAAVASGGYNQNCNDGSGNSSALISNPNPHHNLNTTSLAKLISGNVTNPLTINLSNMMKPGSPNSDISPNSKSSTGKRKGNSNTTDEFGRRKEIRLLKNREAARECRRKKKEYVKCLENRVANLEQQNKVLVDEINRMKELYTKKSSKKVPNIQSEVDSSFTTMYTSEGTPMKEEYYDIVGNNMHQPKTLTSIASISGPNQSSYLSKEISSFHTNAPSGNKEGDNSNLLSKNESAHNTLPPCGNKIFNPTMFPEFRHPPDSKDASECELG